MRRHGGLGDECDAVARDARRRDRPPARRSLEVLVVRGRTWRRGGRAKDGIREDGTAELAADVSEEEANAARAAARQQEEA